MPISAKHAVTLALGAVTLACAAQANAFTAFQSSGPQSDNLVVKGRVAYQFDNHQNGTDNNDHGDGGTRTAVTYTHKFNDDLSVVGSTEWGYDPFFRNGPDKRDQSPTNGKLAYQKRQQFAGVAYKGIGTLTYGKQSAVYSMITDATDQYWIFGTAANGKMSEKHLEGADRPDRSLKYKNTFGGFTVGAMYGANDHNDADTLTRRHFGQAAVTWQFTPTASVGAAYNRAAMSQGGQDFDVYQFAASATWNPGDWNFGVLAGQYDNQVASIKHSRGYETFTQYTFKDLVDFGKVSLYGGINRLEDRDSSARNSSYIVGTALKTNKGFGSSDNFVVAVEHVFNDSKNTSGQDPYGTDHDYTSLLLRYNY